MNFHRNILCPINAQNTKRLLTVQTDCRISCILYDDNMILLRKCNQLLKKLLWLPPVRSDYLDNLHRLVSHACRYSPEFCIQIRIEVSDDHFPVYVPSSTLSSRDFHICGEALVHDLREGFLHNIIDNLAKFGNIEVFIFLLQYYLLPRIVVIVGA